MTSYLLCSTHFPITLKEGGRKAATILTLKFVCRNTILLYFPLIVHTLFLKLHTFLKELFRYYTSSKARSGTNWKSCHYKPATLVRDSKCWWPSARETNLLETILTQPHLEFGNRKRAELLVYHGYNNFFYF